MGKISQVSSKYIINATIEIEGIVERPDVIGAIFGQTEGLLGTELELRELQKSGRIGRIEVNLDTKSGKTKGDIIIPSSLDKAETSIVAAALEIIQRIGPCNAKVTVKGIDDVRISKRAFVMDRAKELLQGMHEGSPGSQEMTDSVTDTFKVKDITTIGKEKLSCGPLVKDGEEIIIVEGRADVVNLLKNGFGNAVAMNGTSVPETIIKLCKDKEVTVFTDGDRGGDLIIRELLTVADINFITKAPDGKEVEELTQKEIHQSLRKKAPSEQVRDEFLAEKTSLRKKSMVSKDDRKEGSFSRSRNDRSRDRNGPRDRNRSHDRNDRRGSRDRFDRGRSFDKPRGPRISPENKEKLKEMVSELKGSKGAFILTKDLEVMGKVPIADLVATVSSLKGTDAKIVVIDGSVEQDLADAGEESRLRIIVGKEVKAQGHRTHLLTPSDLE